MPNIAVKRDAPKAARPLPLVRPATMRYLPLLAVFATSLALANTPGDFVGKDANGLTFSIVMDSADTAITDEYETWKPRYISHYGLKRTKKHLMPINEKQLPSNCIVPRRHNRTEFEFISCDKNHGTPLSGVRYELNRKKYTKTQVQEMTCTKGCNKNVPAIFRYEEQWD